MDRQDLLAPVVGEFDLAEALQSWRWLVPQSVRPLVVTAMGDLFMIAADGSVLFLDTLPVPASKPLCLWRNGKAVSETQN